MHTHHWRGGRHLALALATLIALITLALPAAASPAPPQQARPLVDGDLAPIDLTPQTVIYGDEAGSKLGLYVRGKATFDYNGDGLRDFIVSYWTRAFHPQLRHQHIDILLGMPSWPAAAKVADLRNRVELVFPHPQSAQPDDPIYRLMTLVDLNGDRKDDLVVEKSEFNRDRLTALELDLFYGSDVDTTQPGRPPYIEVAEQVPDFRIRQPAAPRNDAEARTVPMPDRVDSADLNGDGTNDLVLGSCDLVGPGHTSQSQGALLVYMAPFGDAGVLDLSKDEPTTVLYSSNEINVCTSSLSKVNADAIFDVLFTGATTKNREKFNYGAVVFGTAQWAPTNEVGDLVGTRLVNTDPEGDVDVTLKDMDGDRTRDLRGNTFRYDAPAWHAGPECDWFGGAASYPATLDEGTCDYRFTGQTPTEAVDINGDGALDYFFEVTHRRTEPYFWNIAAGPIQRGGEMYVTDEVGSASYLMELPYTTEPRSWRMANVGGTGDSDLLVFEPETRYALPDDGQFSITFGPLTTEAVPPTHTPTPPTAPAPTDTPGVATPTRTPAVPSAPDIPLAVDATLYGAEAGSNLNITVRGRAYFDFNGDGRRDFLASYLTRAYHPSLRQQHLDVVFGTASWPAEAKITDLTNRLELIFPSQADAMPDDPVYRMKTNLDIDGDRKDDLVVERADYLRERMTALNQLVFRGYDVDLAQPGPRAKIDVAHDQPAVRVSQPNAPRNDIEAKSVPMPNAITAADMNNDGAPDLLVSSCALQGPGHTNQSAGALLVYLAPYGDGGVLDLSIAQPDTVFYSSNEIDVCTVQSTNLDADNLVDLIFTGTKTRNRQPYGYGVAVLGRSSWPAQVEVADVVSTRFENADPLGDVDVSLKDMNGDRTRDVRGRTAVYQAPAWRESIECDWFAGAATYPPVLDQNACDFAFTGEQPEEAVDLNADGALDYLFEITHRGNEPYRWNVAMGPIQKGGEMYVTERVGSADYLLTLPYGKGPVSWRFANIGGGGDNDFMVFAPESRHVAPEDGVIAIQLGPVVEPVVVPPTATSPVAPTNTPGVGPTATHTPPAVARPVHIYLPLCRLETGPS